MLKLDKRVKVEEVEIRDKYEDAIEALDDKGYKKVGDTDISYKNSEIRKNVYVRDGKNYIYEGMENDNTFIYKVYIRELKEI